MSARRLAWLAACYVLVYNVDAQQCDAGSSLTTEIIEAGIQSKVYHSTIDLSSGFVGAVALGDELIVVPNHIMNPLQYLITFDTRSHIFTNDKLHFNKAKYFVSCASIGTKAYFAGGEN